MTRQSSATSLASAASTIQNENPSNITITPQASPTQNGITSGPAGSTQFPVPKSRDTLKRGSNGENPYEIIQDETKSIITLPDEMAKFSTPTPPPTSSESIPKIPDKLPASQNIGFERSYKGEYSLILINCNPRSHSNVQVLILIHKRRYWNLSKV